MACLFGLQFPAGVYHWSNPNGGQVEPFTGSGHLSVVVSLFLFLWVTIFFDSEVYFFLATYMQLYSCSMSY